MSERIAFLFAGQGAQVVGMGKDLAEASPAVAALYRQADALLGRSLSGISFEGPEEELTRTANCQPALYVHGLACLEVLRSEVPDLVPVTTAGLSLGEFTAHAAAGTFSFEAGLSLVAQRAAFMQEACEATTGAMAALIGADEESARKLAAAFDVDVANFNCPGQIVLSGEAPRIAAAVEAAKDYNIRRATPLKVAGAYHSRLMASAADKLGAVLATTEIGEPRCTVIANVNAQPVSGADAIRATLREQVTGSVRWTETLERLIDEVKIDRFIEFGPGGVLAGLLNRTRKGTPILSITDIASAKAAAEALKG